MDRITRLRIKNVRAIGALDLEISPVTVLIGENGAGKSTIVECLELMRKATEMSFMQQFYKVHRGIPGLLRKGATELALGVVIEDETKSLPGLEYEFSLVPKGAGAIVNSEQLFVVPADGQGQRRLYLRRTQAEAELFDEKLFSVVPGIVRPEFLMISSYGGVDAADKPLSRLLHALGTIEVHLGFDTLASWAASAAERSNALRSSSMLLPAEKLSLLGQNLASAWSALKNQGESHWSQTMALVRLGLGDNVDSVLTAPDAGGGNISLLLKRKDLAEPIPSAYLSDGQLSWLAFVAMARLDEGRSLLAIDEPELHMHPSLLGRVISMLTHLRSGAPVLLSTHSDRVLELLENPAESTRICELHGSKVTVSKLNEAELPRWLDEFGDLGQLRSSGYLHRLLEPGSELPDTFGEPQ